MSVGNTTISRFCAFLCLILSIPLLAPDADARDYRDTLSIYFRKGKADYDSSFFDNGRRYAEFFSRLDSVLTEGGVEAIAMSDTSTIWLPVLLKVLYLSTTVSSRRDTNPSSGFCRRRIQQPLHMNLMTSLGRTFSICLSRTAVFQFLTGMRQLRLSVPS